MSFSKIKIDKELLKKASEHASKAGYSSVEEFITHIIEKKLSKQDESNTEEEVIQKLKGLGYLS